MPVKENTGTSSIEPRRVSTCPHRAPAALDFPSRWQDSDAHTVWENAEIGRLLPRRKI